MQAALNIEWRCRGRVPLISHVFKFERIDARCQHLEIPTLCCRLRVIVKLQFALLHLFKITHIKDHSKFVQNSHRGAWEWQDWSTIYGWKVTVIWKWSLQVIKSSSVLHNSGSCMWGKTQDVHHSHKKKKNGKRAASQSWTNDCWMVSVLTPSFHIPTDVAFMMWFSLPGWEEKTDPMFWNALVL